MVGRQIFDKVFGPFGLLREKARILVTHGIQYLEQCHRIIILQSGAIAEMGGYQELMAKGDGVLHRLMNDYGGDVVGHGRGGTSSSNQVGFEENGTFNASTNPEKTPESKIMSKEVSAEGSVDSSVYWMYAKACHYGPFFLFIFLSMVSQAVSVGQNLLLSYWAEENDSGANPPTSPFVWLLRYFGLGVFFAIIVVFQVILAWIICGIQAARSLHSDMLNTVLDLPQSFFDTTPLGRVINRFSKDVYMIDEQIPRSFLMFFRTLFSVIAILGVNAVGNPYYLVAAVPLGFLYYRIQKFYLSTSRQLKRLESTSRSPVYAHFQETLQGVSTIRAFEQTHRFIKQSELKVDVNTKAYYCSMSSNRYVLFYWT